MRCSVCDAWLMYGRVTVDLNCGRSSGGRLGLGWLKFKCLYPLSCSHALMWWSSCFKLCWSHVLKARWTNVLWTADLKRGWWNEELCRYRSVCVGLRCTVWARVASALRVTWSSRNGMVLFSSCSMVNLMSGCWLEEEFLKCRLAVRPITTKV